jgi:hypothetical protein
VWETNERGRRVKGESEEGGEYGQSVSYAYMKIK